jgi:hypothetical protein
MNLWLNRFEQLKKDEDGIGTLEMMLIIAVIIIIAISFRKWIMKWVYSLFTTTDSEITNTNLTTDAAKISPTLAP